MNQLHNGTMQVHAFPIQPLFTVELSIQPPRLLDLIGRKPTHKKRSRTVIYLSTHALSPSHQQIRGNALAVLHQEQVSDPDVTPFNPPESTAAAALQVQHPRGGSICLCICSVPCNILRAVWARNYGTA